jgi:hypothetical protein
VSEVAALYIDDLGPYPKLLGADACWGERKDARRYDGPWPVVAHPPCGAWSSMKGLYQGGGRDLVLIAYEQVRRWGGVLEHPITSGFWKLIPPTLVVNQCDWGHVARKRTGLFVSGKLDFPPVPAPRAPTHWCSGVHTPGARGKPPAGIKICSAQQRRRTPVAFAEWLIQVASGAKPWVRQAG